MENIEVICLYLNEYLTSEQFEQYFYSNMSEFENHLDEDIYLDIVSTNFGSKEEKVTLQTKLKEYMTNNFSDLYNNMNDAYVERLIQSGIDNEIVEILKEKYLRTNLLNIDCINIKTRTELIYLVKTSLKFPDFCGNNWNAIRDLLYDMMLPEKIIFSNWEWIEKQLPDDSVIVKKIFDEIKKDYCIVRYN